eukprot:109819-Rhodomonas_salina.2
MPVAGLDSGLGPDSALFVPREGPRTHRANDLCRGRPGVQMKLYRNENFTAGNANGMRMSNGYKCFILPRLEV